MKVYISGLNSIYKHLAIESSLIESKGDSLLFLWRNMPTVVIGRHQNPWKECNLIDMEKENVLLCRRYTGGGAVYQDLGCTQFTIIKPITSNGMDDNYNMLTKALKNLNINTKRSGRNDICTLDGTKICGSAFKITSHNLLHHGTILVNSDLHALTRLLTPDNKKLQSKGISSIRARVSNLSQIQPDISHELLVDALTQQFHEKPEYITDNHHLLQNQQYLENFQILQNWQWRYGSTPDFSHFFSHRIEGLGSFDIHLSVNQGFIEKVKIFSDSLDVDLVSRLQEILTNCQYNPELIKNRIEKHFHAEIAYQLNLLIREII